MKISNRVEVFPATRVDCSVRGLGSRAWRAADTTIRRWYRSVGRVSRQFRLYRSLALPITNHKLPLTSHLSLLTSHFSPLELIPLCLSALLAGFVDATVGGGGLVQIPALFAVLPGVAPAVLLGTNKFAAICGTINASYTYSRRVRLPLQFMALVCILAGLAAVLGAQSARFVSPAWFRLALPIVLGAILAYIIRQKTFGTAASTHLVGTDTIWKGCLIGGLVGWYDGFLGAGTGTFFIFLFIRFLRFDFLHASASAKLVNVSTNLGALILFVIADDVLWRFAIPMAIANAVGGIIGARFAILRGNRFIRRLFILIVVCLLLKTGFDALSVGR
jgi:uncharacterized protein